MPPPVFAAAAAALPDAAGGWAWALGWVQGLAAFVVAFAAAYTDWRRGRVANRLCLAGALAGLALSFARGGWAAGPVSLKASLVLMAAGFVFFWLFYWLGGMGAGDVKLLAALGALIAQPAFFLWTLAYAAMAGLALAVAYLIKSGDVWGGLGRGAGQLVRWRFRTPPPGGRPAWTKPPGAKKTPPAPAGRALAAPATAAALPAPKAENDRPAPVPSLPPPPGGGGEALPAAEGRSPPEAAAAEPDAPAAAGAGGGEAETAPPVFVPYAVALAAGLALAAWQYARRGWALPFFGL